jgi:ankyrin repeat protein
MTQALLEAKADVNAANTNGITALLMAKKQGHTEIAEALLAAKATTDSSSE